MNITGIIQVHFHFYHVYRGIHLVLFEVFKIHIKVYCPPNHFSHFLMTYPCLNGHMVFPRIYLYSTISLFISLRTFELFPFLLLHKAHACMNLLEHTGKCLGDICWLRVGQSLFAKLCPFAPFLAVMSSLSSSFSPTLACCSFNWYICCKYLLPG